ncbi:chloramphenicol phosphotransferase CPT [Streptomyces sp. NBC_00198]|uniref:chloramphenicol phosphotransferase CPT n=1 Tax=Streptomyces sp. NBC_00198 TaxID=2975677 RepID=UPI0022508C4B|nr:chloramphenicol phosphotransferase CPT [Streptomyces sp. NBC_00198]MCX5284150.1 chloramphenicol phosphotransferase CPT [Streptomyces sp. NBC_00198]
MTTAVIVLNGGSSSGKSGIARCLQAVLPDPWLALGTDTLVDAMPAAMRASDTGIEFAPDGEVIVGPEFRTLEAAWIEGIAAMARAGARIIVDEVFLGGPASQRRWHDALHDLPVLWVGVHCDATVAAGRELARGDRPIGMAASQANTVHRGVTYDLEIDTSHTESIECARVIAGRVVG